MGGQLRSIVLTEIPSVRLQGSISEKVSNQEHVVLSRANELPRSRVP